MKQTLATKALHLISALLFLLMITVNALANILPIQGETTGAISDSYVNLFAPTGLTFSVWGVIYLLLGAFVAIDLIRVFKNDAPCALVFHFVARQRLMDLRLAFPRDWLIGSPDARCPRLANPRVAFDEIRRFANENRVWRLPRMDHCRNHRQPYHLVRRLGR